MFSEKRDYRLWPTLIVERQVADTTWHDSWVPQADAEGMFDLFAAGEGNAKIREIINAGVDAWLDEAGLAHMKATRRRFTGAGCVSYAGGEYVPTHWHGGHLSCVYYMQASEGVTLPSAMSFSRHLTTADVKSGSLVLFDPRGAMNQLASAPGGAPGHIELRPQRGTLLVFPSYLQHATTPHMTGRPRVVVAGNVRFVPTDDRPAYL